MKRLSHKQFQTLVPKLREKEFYKEQKQRPILWQEYTLAQIEDAKASLVFIRDSVDHCHSLNLEGQVGKPLTDPKVLAKAILLCELLGLPERQAQGWLEILGPFLGIYVPLDDWVIGEAYNYPEVAYILKQVFDQSKKVSNWEIYLLITYVLMLLPRLPRLQPQHRHRRPLRRRRR